MWNIFSFKTYMWQWSKITLVSEDNNLNRFIISSLLTRPFFILNFTTDKISKVCFNTFLFCKVSAAFMNSFEPEKSVTITEYLNHWYLANKLIIASAWWYNVGANWISFDLGWCFLFSFFLNYHSKYIVLIKLNIFTVAYAFGM